MLEHLLVPKGEFGDYAGLETGEYMPEGVSVLTGEYGSVRYVLSFDGQIVSAIQIVVMDGKARIANVKTRDGWRRRKLATLLFQRVKSDYPDVVHSENIETEGQAWVDSLS